MIVQASTPKGMSWAGCLGVLGLAAPDLASGPDVGPEAGRPTTRR